MASADEIIRNDDPRTSTVCLACGYSLAGLPTDGRCPECATPVARSLRGNMLEYANPDYVRSLQRGVELVMVGTVVAAMWWVATPIIMSVFVGQGRLTFDGGMKLVVGADFLGAVLLLAGYWFLTSPDPALRDSASDVRSRHWLRGLIIFIAVTTLVGLFAILTPGLKNSGLSTILGNVQLGPSTQWTALLIVGLFLRVVMVVAKLARYFVGLIYLRSLAERIPSVELRRATNRQLWLVPLLCTVGLLAFALGPLVALILVLRLLWRFRSALRGVRARMLAPAS
ncbi:MAG: hypothetical protein SGJ09_00450 [Phycisphaerae bacterium]|nr:hypothetical protein [Phycisphaerae bacterium]